MLYARYATACLSVCPPATRMDQSTRKPSYRWQTRATRKPAKIAPIRRAYNVVADNTIFMRLTAIASEIQRNSLKSPTYGVQGHPRSPILVPIESPYVTCY